MKKILFAAAAGMIALAPLSADAQNRPTPGLNMIEFPGHNHPLFPCSDKDKVLKRSKCVDFKGYGGVKGVIYVENYIIHCMTGGTLKKGDPVTYVTWTGIGRCTPAQAAAQEAANAKRK